MGVVDNLKDIYGNLKGSERRVAEYILTHGKEIIQFSITELAERCNCGDATIFRVCKKIGCKGYQEFKIRIAQELIDPIENIHEDIKDQDNAVIIMDKVFKSTMVSLQETLKRNNGKVIENAVELLVKANQINFFGMGGSAALAMDAWHKFTRTGITCQYQCDTHLQIIIASMVKENDVIVAISNSGSNKELIENVALAKANGAKIITVCSISKSPLTKLADVNLISYGQQQKYKNEAAESRISALTLLDCLFIEVCLKNKETYYENIEKVRKSIALKRI